MQSVDLGCGKTAKYDMHGTYQTDGTFRCQTVGLGTVAYTSKPGLFTGGYLAMPLSWPEFDEIVAMEWDQAIEYVARRWGFLLVHR